jgi:signal transduction histidine kinase
LTGGVPGRNHWHVTPAPGVWKAGNAMAFFKLFSPVSYWLLILLWSWIFVFYLRRIRHQKLESRFFTTLLVILAIDAFRTLFESIYFGAWYTSLVGLIPTSIHDFLIRPENVFVPKALNVIAAVLIIVIVLRRWFPQEEEERERQLSHVQALEKEIRERNIAEAERERLITDLQRALDEVKTLRGILPICSFCKKVRDDEGYWRQVDVYIQQQTNVDFSHSVCPECVKTHYPDYKPRPDDA